MLVLVYVREEVFDTDLPTLRHKCSNHTSFVHIVYMSQFFEMLYAWRGVTPCQATVNLVYKEGRHASNSHNLSKLIDVCLAIESRDD